MNICLTCGNSTQNSKFCSRSCSAKTTNKNKKPRTKESRLKTGKSLKKFFREMNDEEYVKYFSATHPNKKINLEYMKSRKFRTKKDDIVEPYTKIYLCVCKHSGLKFYSTTKKHIHPNLSRTINEYRYSCRFNFGISLFPKWFKNASKLINEYGWYSTPGSNKNGKLNTNGISRDHLYSVSDGWRNKISPEIIRHPANCSLIPHTLNQSKLNTSSITLEELHRRIEKFNSLYPGYQ